MKRYEGETIMPQATTLGSPGKAVTFNYTGSVLDGVVIEYDYANVAVNRDFFRRILATFRGRKILGGFSKTDPTPDGFGEWVRDNSKQNSELLTPQHASRIAAILVAERYAESDRNGNAVILKFSA
jgi:hypothetical protein